MFPTLEVDVMEGVLADEVGQIAAERLEAEICQLSADLSASLCRWLLMVAELDRREAWGVWGMRSCAHWLSWRCSIALGTARDHLRVARRLVGLPLVLAGFASGELSYAKVRALARVATPETEDELVGLARRATAPQLERIVRTYRQVEKNCAPNPAERPAPHAYLRVRFDDDGNLVGSFRLAPDDGALLLDAIDSMVSSEERMAGLEAEATDRGTDYDDAPIAGQPGERARAAGLLRLAHAALAEEANDEATEPRPSRRRRRGRTTPRKQRPSFAEPAHLVVHADIAALAGAVFGSDGVGRPAGSTPWHRGHLAGGPGLGPRTLGRLCCDASVQVLVKDRDGNPLHLGRQQRRTTARLRRALLARDGGCRFPGCTRVRFLHAHHIVAWGAGGPTCIDNLVLLCSAHHHAVHEGGFRLAGPAPSMSFVRPDGVPIEVAPAPTPATSTIEARNRRLGVAPTPDTCTSTGNGEPYDLGLTIDALWCLFHPPGVSTETLRGEEAVAV